MCRQQLNIRKQTIQTTTGYGEYSDVAVDKNRQEQARIEYKVGKSSCSLSLSLLSTLSYRYIHKYNSTRVAH